jgi:TP901 family phage tail tape measure protein
MFSAWRVSVILSAVNRTGGAFGSLIASSNTAQQRIMGIQNAIAKVGPIATAAFLTASGALAAFAAHGIKEAANFETAMVNVQVATSTSGKALQDLQSMVLNISSHTAQDATTIASETAMFARAGFNAQQVRQFMPTVAQYADVQMLSHGTDPVDAVRTAAQFLHLEGAYTGGAVSQSLEALNKVSFLSPEDLNKVVTQGRYFIPLAKSLGMSLQDTIMEVAEMGITGFLKGKGGTSVANAIIGGINGVSLTAHQAAGKAQAESRLGLINSDGSARFFNKKTNTLEYANMFDDLAKERDAYIKSGRGLAKFAADVEAVFGKTAMNFVLTKLSPAAREQMHRTEEKYAHEQSINQMFNEFINTWNGLTQLLGTNFKNIMIGIFLPAIKALEPDIKRFGAWVGTISDYINAHPDLGKKIAIGIGIAIAAFATAGAAMAATTWMAISNLARLDLAIASTGATAGAAAGANVVGAVAGGAGKGKFLRYLIGADLFASIFGPLKSGLGKAGEWLFGKVGVPGKSMGRTMFGGMHPTWNATAVAQDASAWAKSAPGRAMNAVGDVVKNARDWTFGRVGQPGVSMGRTALGGRASFNATYAFESVFSKIGAIIMRFAPVIGELGMGVARFGLRLIPIVGWVMLVIQALQLFKAHAGDIGWVLGTIVGWMRFKLFPGIVKAAQEGWTAVSTAVINGIGSMLSSIWAFVQKFASDPIGMMKSIFSGNISNPMQQFIDKFNAASNVQQYSGPGQPASYAARNPGAAGMNLTINVNGGSHPPATIAKHVVNEINRRAPFSMRATAASDSSARIPGLYLNQVPQ